MSRGPVSPGCVFSIPATARGGARRRAAARGGRAAPSSVPDLARVMDAVPSLFVRKKSWHFAVAISVFVRVRRILFRRFFFFSFFRATCWKGNRKIPRYRAFRCSLLLQKREKNQDCLTEEGSALMKTEAKESNESKCRTLCCKLKISELKGLKICK